MTPKVMVVTSPFVADAGDVLEALAGEGPLNPEVAGQVLNLETTLEEAPENIAATAGGMPAAILGEGDPDSVGTPGLDEVVPPDAEWDVYVDVTTAPGTTSGALSSVADATAVVDEGVDEGVGRAKKEIATKARAEEFIAALARDIPTRETLQAINDFIMGFDLHEADSARLVVALLSAPKRDHYDCDADDLAVHFGRYLMGARGVEEVWRETLNQRIEALLPNLERGGNRYEVTKLGEFAVLLSDADFEGLWQRIRARSRQEGSAYPATAFLQTVFGCGYRLERVGFALREMLALGLDPDPKFASGVSYELRLTFWPPNDRQKRFPFSSSMGIGDHDELDVAGIVKDVLSGVSLPLTDDGAEVLLMAWRQLTLSQQTQILRTTREWPEERAAVVTAMYCGERLRPRGPGEISADETVGRVAEGARLKVLDAVSTLDPNAEDVVSSLLLAERFLRHHAVFGPFEQHVVDGVTIEVGRMFKTDRRPIVVILWPVEIANQPVLAPCFAYKSQSQGAWRSSVRLNPRGSSFEIAKAGTYTQGTLLHPELEDLLEGQFRDARGLLYGRLDDLAVIFSDGLSWWAERWLHRTQEEVVVLPTPSLAEIQRIQIDATFVSDAENLGQADRRRGAKLVTALKKVKYPPGFIPDFKQQPHVVKPGRHHPWLGAYTLSIFRGARVDGMDLEWGMAEDTQGRVWIEFIRPMNQKVTRLGTLSPTIDTGFLTAKPLEYYSQVKLLPAKYYRVVPNQTSWTEDPYVDITPLLAELKPVKDFIRSHQPRRRPQPAP